MALSNWDTIAWNERGEPTKGILQCPNGIIVEIYKNWASISNKFKTNIMQFWQGQVHYRNLYLFGKRSIQSSIFLVAIYKDWNKNIIKALFGIGCYGYVKHKWVGVKNKTIEQFKYPTAQP